MELRQVTKEQYTALKSAGFRGYDLYDGLSSRLFRKTPFFRSRKLRLAWIQLFKRSPVNLRPLAMVPRGANPKGLALILRGLVNLYKIEDDRKYLDEAYALAEPIISQRAADREYFCLGYDFFWEARAFSVPERTPNMIVSSFTGQAFLDLFEIDGDEKWLEYALGIVEFMEKELLIRESDEGAVFGYIPGEKTVVHNVNLLASAYLARLSVLSGEGRHKSLASRAAAFTVKAQRADGAWPYGEEQYHRWIDNFHTGFNLTALDTVRKSMSTDAYDASIERGLGYHIKNHYLEDMTPKYFDTSLYPVDIHNFAQGIDTFVTFGYHEKARKLLDRAVEMMWDGRKHYFYYQKHRMYTNRIDYMRWSQAWMFYAMTRFLLRSEGR